MKGAPEREHNSIYRKSAIVKGPVSGEVVRRSENDEVFNVLGKRISYYPGVMA